MVMELWNSLPFWVEQPGNSHHAVVTDILEEYKFSRQMINAVRWIERERGPVVFLAQLACLIPSIVLCRFGEERANTQSSQGHEPGSRLANTLLLRL
jgi:hypothetical protein